jgi:hypothetical protein
LVITPFEYLTGAPSIPAQAASANVSMTNILPV